MRRVSVCRLRRCVLATPGRASLLRQRRSPSMALDVASTFRSPATQGCAPTTRFLVARWMSGSSGDGKGRLAVNRQIRQCPVRLATEHGSSVVTLKAAMSMAYMAGKDLVQVSDQQAIPVCRIGFASEFAGKTTEQLTSAGPRAKEVRFSSHIEEYDMQIKVDKVRGFLEKGHTVKLTVYFRGEIEYDMQFGREILENIVERLDGGFVRGSYDTVSEKFLSLYVKSTVPKAEKKVSRKEKYAKLRDQKRLEDERKRRQESRRRRQPPRRRRSSVRNGNDNDDYAFGDRDRGHGGAYGHDEPHYADDAYDPENDVSMYEEEQAKFMANTMGTNPRDLEAMLNGRGKR